MEKRLRHAYLLTPSQIGKEILYSIPSHECAIADIIAVRYEKLVAAQRVALRGELVN